MKCLTANLGLYKQSIVERENKTEKIKKEQAGRILYRPDQPKPNFTITIRNTDFTLLLPL